jgi:hypothetical protein
MSICRMLAQIPYDYICDLRHCYRMLLTDLAIHCEHVGIPSSGTQTKSVGRRFALLQKFIARLEDNTGLGTYGCSKH